METNNNEEINKIAHQLNSPLTALIGYISLIKKGLNSNTEKEKLSQWLENVEENIEAIKEMIQKLNDKTHK